MTLDTIIKDERFSTIKEVRQKRSRRAGKSGETEHRVGFCMFFDGLEFRAADLDSVTIIVSNYIRAVDVVEKGEQF